MAAIGQTLVSLRVFGDELEPDEITQILGQAPTRFHRKGDRRSPSDFIEKSSLWIYSIEKDRPGDLDAKICQLLDAVSNDSEKWAYIHRRFKADIFAGIFMAETNEGLVLQPSTMTAVSRLGLELHLDIYDPTPNGD